MNLGCFNNQHRSDKGYRLATTAFFFISGFGYSSWASRIPAIKEQLHLSEAEFGTVLFAFPIGLMLTMPFTRRILNVMSSRYCMLLGAILFNVVLALPGFAAYVWQLVLILLIFGGSRNILNLSMNAQALEVQRLYSKSIMTTFHAIWSLAGFAGAGLGYVMVTQHIDPSFHLLGISITMLAVTVVFYPLSIECEPSKEEKKFFSIPDKSLLNFAIICFISMACENTMYDWSGIYFQNVLHASQKITTAAFVFFMIAVTLGRFCGDYGVMRFGIKNMLLYSAVLVSTGFLLCFVMPFVISTILGFVLIGVGVSCTVPLVFSIAGKSKNLSSGSALTSISTIGYLGFLVVPPMVGYISEVLSMKWAFFIMSFLGGIMIYLVSRISEEN